MAWDEQADLDQTVDDATEQPPRDAVSVSARYVDLGAIGQGGTAEVRRVLDQELQRTVAIKLLRAEHAGHTAAAQRFVTEARVMSRLEHPGILPVYDLGRTGDGRPWFTMKEVRGRTLASLIHDGEPLRRLIEVFRVVCDAIAYAHASGVLHRDIKPANILVGDFGEVLVVDWGLSRPVSESADDLDETEVPGQLKISGTPSYMSPEAAAGEAPGVAADVFTLGATLFELLTGSVPFTGSSPMAVVARILGGDMPVPHGPHLDPELVRLCTDAMQREPDRRPSAVEVARRVGEWLEGARVRERALGLVEQADSLYGQARELRDRAEAAEDEAARMLEGARTFDPERRKHSGWLRQDEAARFRRQAQALDVERLNTLRAALAHVPDLAPAHARLAAYFHGHHQAAEAEGDRDTAERAAALLATHDRGTFAAYLAGTGAVTLLTEPSGAKVELFRYVERHRRLVPEHVRDLGHTPVVAQPLDMGSYLLKIRKPGHHEVLYPVNIGRQQHWDGVGPGASEPTPIHLPGAGELDEDDVYIPAGWFEAGGDPEALDGLPLTRVWVSGFVIKRYPVTVAEYLDFLNDLVEAGRGDDAERFCPRQRAGAQGAQGALLWGRAKDGSFLLVPDAEGDLWHAQWPVIMVDWFGAMAYADWLAHTSGQPWRLPIELEWAKAARGVDRRRFAWGNFLEPSWSANRDAFADRPMPVPIDQFPIDESPYGVRGVCGNTRDWLLDAEPFIHEQRAVVPTDVDRASLGLRRRRGGAWLSRAGTARLAKRDLLDPRDRNFAHGFRVVRSV